MSKGMAEVRREQKAEAEAATHRKSGPPTRGSVALLVQPRRPQAASQSWAALELGSSEAAPKWNVSSTCRPSIRRKASWDGLVHGAAQ